MQPLARLASLILSTLARSGRQPGGQQVLRSKLANVRRRLNPSANGIAPIRLKAGKRRNDMVLFLVVYFSIICCLWKKNSVYI